MTIEVQPATPALEQGQVTQQEPGQPDQGGRSEREQARGAASAAIRELLDGAEKDEDQAAEQAAPEPEKKAPRGKAKPAAAAETEPEPEIEPPPPAGEQPLKPSERQEMKRRQKAIERRHAEMEQLAQRIEADRKAIEHQRAQDAEWDRELRRDPVGAVARRLGVTPDRIVAGFADGKAQQLDPLVAAEIDRLRGDLAAEKKAREDRETQLREQSERMELQQNIENDVGWFSDAVPQKAGDQFPHWSALPTHERQVRAREAIMLALRYEPDIEKGEILEALESRAREIADGFNRSERLQRLRGGTTQSSGNGASKPHGKPAPSGTRPSAREAAEPAERGAPSTLEDRRKLAAASIREMQSKSSTG